MTQRTIQICIPIARKQRTQASYERLFLMKESLLNSIRRLPEMPISFDVHAVINGRPTRSDFSDVIASSVASIMGTKGVSQVRITTQKTSGKISVVNRAITEAREALGLIVIDDDIIVPCEAITEMTRFLSPRIQHAEAFCFPKTSVDYIQSFSEFAAHQQFLLHPSVQRLLLRMGVFENSRRPCGSLYAIHQTHLKLFPDPCNEADVFKDRRIQMSEHFVRTWYPKSFADEVARRKIHVLTKKKSPIPNMSSYSFAEINGYEAMLKRAPASVPKKISIRIYNALRMMKAVFKQAEKEVNYGSGA